MKDIFNFFEKPKDPLSFSAIRISLASPERIREWSHGEVKKPETINGPWEITNREWKAGQRQPIRISPAHIAASKTRIAAARMRKRHLSPRVAVESGCLWLSAGPFIGQSPLRVHLHNKELIPKSFHSSRGFVCKERIFLILLYRNIGLD